MLNHYFVPVYSDRPGNSVCHSNIIFHSFILIKGSCGWNPGTPNLGTQSTQLLVGIMRKSYNWKLSWNLEATWKKPPGRSHLAANEGWTVALLHSLNGILILVTTTLYRWESHITGSQAGTYKPPGRSHLAANEAQQLHCCTLWLAYQ